MTPDELLEALERRATDAPHRTAVTDRRRGTWTSTTWAELAATVQRCTTGLRSLGAGPGHRIAVLSANRPEMLIAEHAAAAAGAPYLPLHPNLESAAIARLLSSAIPTLVLVEDLQVARTLPPGTPTVVLGGTIANTGAGATRTWASLLAGTAADGPTSTGADDATTVVVDTTGRPTPMTYEPATAALLDAAVDAAASVGPDDRIVAQLSLADPLAHALIVELHLRSGAQLGFVESAASWYRDLEAFRPTVLLSRCSSWEKVHGDVGQAAATASLIRRRLLRAAGLTDEPSDNIAARLLVRRAARARLGMNACRTVVAADAPLPPTLTRWFSALGVRTVNLTEHLPAARVDTRLDRILGRASSDVGEPPADAPLLEVASSRGEPS